MYRKRHNLTEKDKIFICSNAYPTLIAELLRRGWHRNKDRKSAIFHLKYVILESESSMMAELQPWQLVNHFIKNNLIVTKTGLFNSLKNLVWWSTIPMNQFFPRCYELTDFRELEEYKEDYRVTRAEVILKKYLRRKAVIHVEKLLIAIFINERRLRDVDECLDEEEELKDQGAEDNSLVPDYVWSYIEKDKSEPETLQALRDCEWYKRI